MVGREDRMSGRINNRPGEIEMPETVTKKEPLSIRDLRRSQLFLELTPKLRTMVEAYIANGYDKTAAVKHAYDCKSIETARTMSFELFAKPSVQAVLAYYFQEDPRETFMREVDRAVRNPRVTDAKVQALILKGRANGWIAPAEDHL
jgi:hypothetical protein